jgi:hypothetical protein
MASAGAIVVSAAVFATTGAGAQTVRPPNFPTQSVEMIAPGATVASTVHYQAMIMLTCGGNICRGNFNRVRRHQQLHITRAWCDAGSNPSWSYGDLYLYDTKGNLLLQEGLPLSASDPANGFYQISRAVDLQVDAGQLMQIILAFSGATLFGSCTVAGTLSTLQ